MEQRAESLKNPRRKAQGVRWIAATFYHGASSDNERKRILSDMAAFVQCFFKLQSAFVLQDFFDFLLTNVFLKRNDDGFHLRSMLPQ